MTRADKLTLLTMMDERLRRRTQRKLLTYYPDDGPLRRELYPRHCAFFRAGETYRQRLFLAANRIGKCITADSEVETLAGRQTVRALLATGRPFGVWAWDGTQRVRAWASVPFRKPGLHWCYRLTMADGQTIEVADHHRILCVDGWRRLSELLPQFGLSPLPSLPLACAPPIVLSDNKIISVEPIGRKEVYDFTVEKYHNYIAADLIHHNTEGVGLYELTLHATGRYPTWWQGRRFDRPIQGWAAGDTQKTVRDILQAKLFGPVNLIGTGVLPGEYIERTVRSHGVAEAIEAVHVRHVSGGTSKITLKSYEQRREAFQGTEQDVILLDEEPPLDIYTECLLRTATNNGMLMLTFTPLRGISDVVIAFLPDSDFAIEDEGRGDPVASRYVVMAGWDDVPHLTASAKAQLLASIPPFQRDARTRGVPQLGAGAIYPVPESEILVDDFEIPKHWPRAYGLDVGWNWTAATWLGWNRESDVIYLYSAYKRGQAEPSVHTAAIKARGEWIPGVIDPASSGSSQMDGRAIIDVYNRLGLKLSYANNEVEAGIYDVWERLSTGRLKVFKSLTEWSKEYRLYRRDEKGKVVKKDDHLMDGTRYVVRSGLAVAKVMSGQKKDKPPEYVTGGGSGSWMGQ